MTDVYVTCIKTWKSALYPSVCYGDEGKVYRVLHQLPLLTATPVYLRLEGVDPLPDGSFGWVNADRFEKVEK